MNMRQFHILFNSAKTWHVIVCWFLCFPPNLPELNLKLFCSDVQNIVRFSSGKFEGKHRNKKTIPCKVLAELNKIWSCLIFIKLYLIRIARSLLESRVIMKIESHPFYPILTAFHVQEAKKNKNPKWLRLVVVFFLGSRHLT